jgi:hypothetical protein
MGIPADNWQPCANCDSRDEKIVARHNQPFGSKFPFQQSRVMPIFRLEQDAMTKIESLLQVGLFVRPRAAEKFEANWTGMRRGVGLKKAADLLLCPAIPFPSQKLHPR